MAQLTGSQLDDLVAWLEINDPHDRWGYRSVAKTDAYRSLLRDALFGSKAAEDTRMKINGVVLQAAVLSNLGYANDAKRVIITELLPELTGI